MRGGCALQCHLFRAIGNLKSRHWLRRSAADHLHKSGLIFAWGGRCCPQCFGTSSVHELISTRRKWMLVAFAGWQCCGQPPFPGLICSWECGGGVGSCGEEALSANSCLLGEWIGLRSGSGGVGWSAALRTTATLVVRSSADHCHPGLSLALRTNATSSELLDI